MSAQPFAVAHAPPGLDCHVAAIGPAKLLEALHKCRHATLRLWIVRRERIQHTDAPHSLRLLRARRERPRCCRAAEQRDERAPLHHSITSSAVARTLRG